MDALQRHARDKEWHWRALRLMLSRALRGWAAILAIAPDPYAVARLRLRSRMRRWLVWTRDEVLFKLRGYYRVFPRFLLVHWRAMAAWRARELSARELIVSAVSRRNRLHRAVASLLLVRGRPRGPEDGGDPAVRLHSRVQLAALRRWRSAAAEALSCSRARLACQLYIRCSAGARLFASLASCAAETGARVAKAMRRRVLGPSFGCWADASRLLSEGRGMRRRAERQEKWSAARRMLCVWRRAPPAVSAEAALSRRVSAKARLRCSFRRLLVRSRWKTDAVCGRAALLEARRGVRCAHAFGRWREARARAALALLRRAVARAFALPRALAAVRPRLRVWRGHALTACTQRRLFVCALPLLASVQRRRCLEAIRAWGLRVQSAQLDRRARRTAQHAVLTAALEAWRAHASTRRLLPCAALALGASRVRRRCAAGIAAWRTTVLCAHPPQLWPAQAVRSALRTWRALHRIAAVARTVAHRRLRWRLSTVLCMWRRLLASVRQARWRSSLASLGRRQLALPPAMLQWRCAAAVRALYTAQRPRVRAHLRELRPDIATLCWTEHSCE